MGEEIKAAIRYVSEYGESSRKLNCGVDFAGDSIAGCPSSIVGNIRVFANPADRFAVNLSAVFMHIHRA